MLKKLGSVFVSLTLVVSMSPSFAFCDPQQTAAQTNVVEESNESESSESRDIDQSASLEEDSLDEAASSDVSESEAVLDGVLPTDDVSQSVAEEVSESAAEVALADFSTTIDDGVYQLVPASNAALAASIEGNAAKNGDNMSLGTYQSFATQKFKLASTSDGYYTLTCVESGQAVDVVASGTTSGTNVTQWPLTGADNQLWSISVQADGSYVFTSKCNSLLLSSGLGGSGSSNICVASPGAASVQSWKLVSSQTVSDAAYYVSASTNTAQVLDVSAGSLSNGGNVTLWDKTSVRWQRWEFIYQGNGYYELSPLHSLQALDVVASGTTPGTNVTQWPACGTKNQQWDIVKQTDGSYRIVSRCNGLELTADDAKAGSNVVCGKGNVTTWSLSDANDPVFSKTVSDGVYEIANFANASECLDVVAGGMANGTNITLWTYYGATRQKYRVNYEGDGWYSIKAMHSGQSLDIVASSMWPGANVTQWPYYGNDNQLWGIVDNGDGTFTLYSKLSGMVLGCSGSAVDGANVEVQSPTNANTQKWQLNKVYSEASVDDGVYLLASYTNTDFVCDVVAGSDAEGANITLWNKTNPAWQRFRIMSAGDGYYRIAPLHSGQTMDVVASGKASGTNVTQWSYFGNDNQLWKIYQLPDGALQFVSKCNDLALDVQGDIAAGSNVCVSTPDENRAQQKWELIKCSTRDSFKIYLDAGHGWDSSNPGEYDPGAQALGYVENNLTTEIVAKVAEICREQYGLTVYANTTGGDYRKRHPEAVKLACSTFLSFHFNSGGGFGVESYIHSYNAAAGSPTWQKIIHRYMVAGTGLTDRGMKSEAFAVVGGKLPSVLMELGFIDNVTDMQTYRARFSTIAAFLAAGINEASSNSACQA